MCVCSLLSVGQVLGFASFLLLLLHGSGVGLRVCSSKGVYEFSSQLPFPFSNHAPPATPQTITTYASTPQPTE